MKVERIDHIHVFVKNLEEAMQFFTDILGTKFIGPLDRRPQRQLRLAFDTLGIELVSPMSMEEPWGPVMEREGEGVFAIGLKVTDIEEAIIELEAKGIKLDRRAEFPGLKVAIFCPENAYGVRFELVEYAEITPVGIALAGKMSELPWFKS
jgi:methylmalonyl-CoA/ethylmalonyl-CoA epimerase